MDYKFLENKFILNDNAQLHAILGDFDGDIRRNFYAKKAMRWKNTFLNCRNTFDLKMAKYYASRGHVDLNLDKNAILSYYIKHAIINRNRYY